MHKLWWLLVLVLVQPAWASERLKVVGDVPDFTLTNQQGQTVHRHDLDGAVWVADFIYTTCPGPCPLLTHHMAELAGRLPSGVRLVSFTVDPGTDTPPVLAAYAQTVAADPHSWWFLTGPEDTLRKLYRDHFHVAADQTTGGLVHSPYFVLVDGQGNIRGYYDGSDESQFPRLISDADALVQGRWAVLPSLEAGFNALSAVLIVLGFTFIRRHQVAAHKACMLSAFVSSSIFLACYLTYHAHVHHVAFPGLGAVRTAYLSVLVSHSILAVAVVPLVLITLSRAWRGQFDRHKAVARWTWPIWLYVSCTGVLVYLMLYHWYS